jgi:NDP-sugar pyrophosphorylase family protein
MSNRNKNLKPDAVLILSAGKGERLRPITEFIPKPLIDIEGIPVFAFSLFLAYKAGFREFIVNTHHLAETLEERLKEFGKKKGIEFKFIREKKLLGTGGTIKYVFEKFKFRKILVMNSDIVCDADIESFIKSWSESDSLAHIMIKEGKPGGVEVDKNTGKVVRIYGEGKGGNFTFTGIHLVKSEIKDFLDNNNKKKTPLCIVKDGYSKILDEGKSTISFFIHDGFFSDVGTHSRLSETRRTVSEIMSNADDKLYNFFISVKKFIYEE